MSNFASKDINVYPLSTTRNTKANTNGPLDTYISEFAITNILKFLSDNESFVCSENVNSVEFCFVVKGYMFRLKNINNYLVDSKPLYVTLVKKSDTGIFTELESDSNFDSDNAYFNGLTLSQTSGDLQLLDANGNIPDNSKIKFNIAKSTDFFSDYKIIVDGNGILVSE